MVNALKSADFIRQEGREFGTTTLLTTHDLSDIEELCQRLIDACQFCPVGALEAVAQDGERLAP